MKNICLLLITTLTLSFTNCITAFKVSETIQINTTKENFDNVYHDLVLAVMNIKRDEIQEKIYLKYPEAIKNYVERIDISSVKSTESFKKRINNKTTNRETSGLSVEIEMRYERSKSVEAKLIIKDYKALVIDELIKKNINAGKE